MIVPPLWLVGVLYISSSRIDPSKEVVESGKVGAVVVVALVPSSALKPTVCSVDVPMAAAASFEALGFRPAPARAPPCEPFVFCTFALFLFGDELMLMEQGHNTQTTVALPLREFLLECTQTADGRSDLAAEGRKRFWAAKGCMGGPRRQKSSLDSLGIQVGTLNLIKISGVVCTYNPHSLQPCL